LAKPMRVVSFTSSVFLLPKLSRIVAMRLRSQRPLHVQGDAGHPG
jgi:hypothetical protein